MEIFVKYQEEEGFTNISAERVLKAIGSQIHVRLQKILFDLSQMTVIDEEVNAAEYDDMELVEFLEFLVRVAYHQYPDARSIQDKLSDLLREIFQLANVQFIESPKHPLQTQASEEDITAFQKWMKRQ